MGRGRGEKASVIKWRGENRTGKEGSGGEKRRGEGKGEEAMFTSI